MHKNKKRIRHIINAVCGLIIICIVCTGAVYDAAGIDLTITEIDEFNNITEESSVRTRQDSVEDVFEENDIQIGLYDKTNINADSTLENGDEIIIRRGIGITISCDNILTSTSSTYNTVGEALIENGFFLEENDYSIPDVNSEITEGMNIAVIRVNSTIETRDEITPYETIVKDDNTLYEGQKKVSVKGVNGVTRVSENVVFENGAEVSRTEISREPVTEKVDEIVLKGTKKKEVAPKATKASPASSKKSVSAGTTPSGLNYKKKMAMTATAYSAFKKGGGYGITASGRTAKYGVVAVDPKVIPLGTKLYVEGYGHAIAADTGGAIKGNKIDLCFEKSNKELMAFGRKTVQVYILE